MQNTLPCADECEWNFVDVSRKLTQDLGEIRSQLKTTKNVQSST